MADSTVKEWIDTENAQEQETIAFDMAGSIDLGVMTIPSFLQELQPYLNADATLIEAGNGMKLFSMVMTRLQGELGRIELHSLVEYLCDRLENKDTIPNYRAGVKETALSLQALANMTGRFPRGDASVITKSVFSLASTTLRDQKAASRLILFQLLDLLLQKYAAPIARDIGNQKFVEGLVSMAELEKDPSCLRVLFQMYEQISQTWTLDDESFKNIWDSYSRYFPITLGGVARDPSLPTPEELKVLLLHCFTSNDKYAKEAFPRLIDMLDTTQDFVTANVKNDVLDTLAACVSSYSASTISEWSSKLWDALKFEIWDGTNDEFIQRALKVLQAITKKLDNILLDWDSLDAPLARFVKDASTECSQRLHDSKQQHVLGSGQILHEIGSASHLAFHLITRIVLPRMFVIWQDSSSREKKTPLLGVFNSILQARLDLRSLLTIALNSQVQNATLSQYLQNSENNIAASLSNYQQRLVDDVYFDAMTENDTGEAAVDTPFRINTIQGLVILMRIPNFLLDFDKGTIIDSLNNIALDRTRTRGVHDEAVSALQQMSVHDPNRFRDITLPSFIGGLPNSLDPDRDELDEVMFILEALLQISCTATCRDEFVGGPFATPTTNLKHRVFDKFLEGLLLKMRTVLSHQNQLPYANVMLAAMYRGLELFNQVLEQEKTVGDILPQPNQKEGPFTWFIMDLYQNLLQQKQYGGHHPSSPDSWYMGFRIDLDTNEAVNDMFVSLISRITTLALRSEQTTPLNNFLFNAEQPGKPSQIWNLFNEDLSKDRIDDSCKSLQYGPAEKYLTDVLSMSLVAGVRREDKERLKISIGETAMAMIRGATSIENNDCSHYARVSMLYFLQLLINKFGATKEKLEDGRTLLHCMTELAEGCRTNVDDLAVERVYQTLAYFATACLAALDRSDKTLIEHMILGITNTRVGRKVSQSFRILLAPSEVMNEQNFCVMRKIRKQRLYEFTVNKIIGMWRENKEKEAKENCLIALAGIFAYMEPDILEENATTIFPIVLEGTNVQNDDFTKFTYIQIIRNLISARPELIESYLDSVINRMTDRTHNTYNSPSDASVRCRAAALDVLALLVVHVEKEALMKRKAKIMVELDVALDDCSRTVRQSAERCKMRWFNLVEAGEA